MSRKQSLAAPRIALAIHSKAALASAFAGLLTQILSVGAAQPAPPPPAQSPLPPAQSKLAHQLADPGLSIDWIAAEPDVVSPVSIAWDAAQRLYVVEMRDYPSAATGGRVRRLTDANGDGRYENPETIAEGLAFPTSVLPYRDGVLVLAPPSLWYIPAPEQIASPPQKTLLISGFGAGNQQLRANGLTYGIDGWIYGANGRSDGQIAARPPFASLPVPIVGRDFRFHPASLAIESLPGRSQFGLALDDWNNRFLSWNTIPARHEVFPERWLGSAPAPFAPSPEILHDVLPSEDSGEVFPAAPPPRVFNNESSSHFNALSGLTLFRGDALGPDYYGNLFVGESLLNLVHRRRLEPDGLSFRAPRAETRTEFIRSSDPWFHPVNFATGPDGALYVVDFYRQFVEHPDWVSSEMRSRVDWASGAQHGRIWRVQQRNRSARMATLPPPLSTLTPESWITRLSHPNAWQRDTAARLLREKFTGQPQPPSSLPEALAGSLAALLHPNHPAPATVHALCLLADLGQLAPRHLASAAASPHPRVRETALRLLLDSATRIPGQNSPSDPLSNPETLARWIPPLIDDPDPRVAVAALIALRALPDSNALPLLTAAATRIDASPWRQRAWITAASPRALPLLQLWLKSHPQPDWTNPIIRRLVRALAAELPPPQSALAKPFLDQISTAQPRPRLLQQPEFWIGWISAHHRASPSPSPLPFDAAFPPGAESTTAAFREVRSQLGLLRSFLEADFGLENCLQLCQQLGDPTPIVGAFKQFAHPATAPEAPPDSPLAQTLAAAIAESAPHVSVVQLLSERNNWRTGIAPVLFIALASRGLSAQTLFDSLQNHSVHWDELPPLARIRLRQSLTNPARALLDSQIALTSDRRSALDSRRDALRLPGRPEAGGRVAATHCLACHYLLGKGARVGPDLSAVASRSPETLLVDILDPNAQIAPNYAAAVVTLHSGDSLAGLLGDSSTHLVRIRKAGGADETLLRSNIRSVENTGRSLMPEGFEAALSSQDLADLISFLRSPKPEWLAQ